MQSSSSAFSCAGHCSLKFLCCSFSTVLCCTFLEAWQVENTCQSHQMQGMTRNFCINMDFGTQFQAKDTRLTMLKIDS